MVQASVLLPAARIDVFSKQEHTLQLVKSLDDDWRFARIILGLQQSDLSGAIEYYKTHDSPNLIVIQTDEISDDLTSQLESLAEQCSEDTQCLIIGPENDVKLYRELTGMGVSDYLVHPVDKEDFVSSMSKILLSRLGQTDSHLISVIGTKGGVGTTNVSALLASGMSELARQKTLIMDEANAWSNLSVSMGFEPSAHMGEVYNAVERDDEDALNRIILKKSDKLSVLGTGSGGLLDITSSESEFEAVVDYMMQQFPYVIVDLSLAKRAVQKAILARSHAILIVTTTSLYALRTARSLIKELKDTIGADNASKLKLVINQQGRSASNEVGLKDIKAALDMVPDVEINFDPKVFLGSESSGEDIAQTPKGKKAQVDLLKALEDIFGNVIKHVEEETKSSSLGGKIGSIFKK